MVGRESASKKEEIVLESGKLWRLFSREISMIDPEISHFPSQPAHSSAVEIAKLNEFWWRIKKI